MLFALFPLVAGLLFIAGVIWLQFYLSKRNTRWLGLILPAISVMYSLIMVLGIAAFGGMGIGELLTIIVSTFLFANLPTYVLLGIYFGCREKLKKNKEIDRMNLQDL